MARPLWLIYALGGGLGHLTRACALARAGAHEARIRILTNSPHTSLVEEAMPELEVERLDPGISVEEGREEVLRRIAAASAQCLIVDTFPRGLAGELVDVLPTFRGLKVLVQRDLNPQYAAKYELRGFVADCFDVVLDAGDAAERLGRPKKTVTTAPWLIRSAHEMMSRVEARRLLGVKDEMACIVVCAAGNADELDWYGEVMSRLLEGEGKYEVRCIAPVRPEACPAECWVRYWPAMDLYPGADVAIGGAGYNTVYECEACGVPLVARAWPRKYDRQQRRACRAAWVVDEPGQAASAAIEALGMGKRRSCFDNGVGRAVQQLVAMSLHRTGPSSIR